MIDKQRTIEKEVSFEGIGLHTGKTVKITVKPAAENSGIIFYRVDEDTVIPANASSFADKEDLLRRTCIGSEGVYVNTIEHLMVCFSVLGIDNAVVEIDDEEVPGMDGSSSVFYSQIKSAGLVEQSAARNYKVVTEPLWIDRDEASIVLLPYDGFKVSYTLDYAAPEIGSDYFEVDLDNQQKLEQMLNARTFCLAKEAEALQKMGLGKGANYDNTCVVDSQGPIESEFRFDKELVAHKTLDLIGDLYVAGPIKAHVIAIRCGHGINKDMVLKLNDIV